MSRTQMTSAASFAAFQHVLNDIARPLKAETALNSHPGGLANTLPTIVALREQYPAGAYPYLLGEERFGRYMAIMLECGSARLAALEPGTR